MLSVIWPHTHDLPPEDTTNHEIWVSALRQRSSQLMHYFYKKAQAGRRLQHDALLDQMPIVESIGL